MFFYVLTFFQKLTFLYFKVFKIDIIEIFVTKNLHFTFLNYLFFLRCEIKQRIIFYCNFILLKQTTIHFSKW